MLPKFFISGLERNVASKKSKTGAVIAQSSRKPLVVRYAEVLKLREAVAQTQSQLKSRRQDRVVRTK